LLSFLFYYLLKHPHAYKKAQEEVDQVIGTRKITIDHLSKLPYNTAVVRETLRLSPTAPAFGVAPRPTKTPEDPMTIGKGKYLIGKNEPIIILLRHLHRDPQVYGADASEFKPERMLDENFDNLPKNAWKPFGNGMRACIGRPFAWQEALLLVAILLQNFNFQMANPSYHLQIKETLTIKPKDFFMHATLRHGLEPSNLGMALSAGRTPSEKRTEPLRIDRQLSTSAQAEMISIYYGSNTGTCEAFARRLADDAMGYGFTAEIHSLDDAAQIVPKHNPVVFIAASYEGKPADNAAHFFEWLTNLNGEQLEGVNYAVFGCGHRK
jgi:cytochrome P450/NADPH-cytochrome P450 reductase